MTITEAIIVAIIAAVAGAITGWLQTRGVNKKASADAAKVFQEMALTEAKKREELEEKLNKKIASLEEDNEALLGRLAAVLAELNAIKAEKTGWQGQEARMQELIAALRLEKDQELAQLRDEKDQQLAVLRKDLRAIHAEKAQWEEEKTRLEKRITDLQLEKDQEKVRMEAKIKELQTSVQLLNKKTGSLPPEVGRAK